MAKTAREIRAEKDAIKKQMAKTQKSIEAGKQKSARIQHRKDPGDRPKNPGAKIKADNKAAVIKTTGNKGVPNKSRIKTISKPVNRRRKIQA